MNETVTPNRRARSAALIIIAILGLGGLLTLPFFFESPSINYKIGWDKIMLRSGKMVGLAAAFSLLVQLPLAGRLKWMDQIYSLPGLYYIHRINAYCLGLLVLIHPVLVFAPDDMMMIPFEGRYWPEWVGAALLIAIACQIIISRWRSYFFNAYQKWQTAHRILGTAAMGLVILHILFVSETFEQAGFPRTLVLIIASLLLALWLWIRTRPARTRKAPYQLTSIQPAGKDAYTLELEPLKPTTFNYLPGQFVFLSIASKQISKECHPFTLSSSPSRPKTIQFTIRCCGDWTDKIHLLQKGDRATVEGAYGLFSYSLLPPQREIIFIAGGIGITPILSMLRHMADEKAQRPVTLLWSNQSRAHLFGREELTTLAQQLTAFTWIPIFTREKTREGHSGRLDQAMLASLLEEKSRDAAVYICGPPRMIQQVGKNLKQIGFSSHGIYTELFGL